MAPSFKLYTVELGHGLPSGTGRGMNSTSANKLKITG